MRCTEGALKRIRAKGRLLLALVGLVAAGLPGCFGGGKIIRASDYDAAVPEGWKEHEKGESDRAYRLPSGSLVTVTSSCHKHADADLHVLTRHLLMGTRDVSFRKQSYLEVNGAKGLYSSVEARLDRKPIRFEVFVISKNDCIFDFTLMNRGRIPEKDILDFQSFFTSFRYGKNAG